MGSSPSIGSKKAVFQKIIGSGGDSRSGQAGRTVTPCLSTSQVRTKALPTSILVINHDSDDKNGRFVSQIAGVAQLVERQP